MKTRFKVIGVSVGVLALALGASAFQGTPATMWIYGWNGGPVWLRLGPTLPITNGQIDVVLPPTTARRVNVAVAYEVAAKGWKLPANASNLTVYVNGLRYSPANYKVAAGLMTANFGNLLPEHEVVIDYDELR